MEIHRFKNTYVCMNVLYYYCMVHLYFQRLVILLSAGYHVLYVVWLESTSTSTNNHTLSVQYRPCLLFVFLSAHPDDLCTKINNGKYRYSIIVVCGTWTWPGSPSVAVSTGQHSSC